MLDLLRADGGDSVIASDLLGDIVERLIEVQDRIEQALVALN